MTETTTGAVTTGHLTRDHLPAAPAAGRADFDFLFGDWRVEARRAVDVLDPDCVDWREFTMSQTVRPLPGGLGNTDSCETAAGPDGRPFHGLSVRLFDPRDRTWRIWWASDRNPGHLDPPLVGRFDGGRGLFHGRDRVRGRDLDVRFEWTVTGADTATWVQSFRLDAADPWFHNFTMAFTRV
jgi:hypothetical protein